jgi:hypothetical protein
MKVRVRVRVKVRVSRGREDEAGLAESLECCLASQGDLRLRRGVAAG